MMIKHGVLHYVSWKAIPMEEFLQCLLERHAEVLAQRAAIFDQRSAILTAAGKAGHLQLTDEEQRAYDALTESLSPLDTELEALSERIAEMRTEIQRAGRDGSNPLLASIRGSGHTTDSAAASWAQRTAQAITALGGERRAITSGSLDVPSLVEPSITVIPHPARILDLLVGRKSVEGNAYEYYQQTARTNAAAPVPDAATKPTSTLTVTPVQDRCRVVAHLSEAFPVRLMADIQSFQSWLTSEMAEGVLDALEAQIVSGSGTGENMRGILNTAGTTAVVFATDVTTTLRSAITALQLKGEQPNGWVMHPADAQAIDLTRWGTSGGLLTGGYESADPPSSNNIFGTVTPRVVSPSIPQSTALLADWNQARLYQREGVRVDIDLSGAELFDKNLAKMRGEGRFGFAVLRPQAFAVVDLTA
jgi:HK97 family phage major capsid protein